MRWSLIFAWELLMVYAALTSRYPVWPNGVIAVAIGTALTGFGLIGLWWALR